MNNKRTIAVVVVPFLCLAVISFKRFCVAYAVGAENYYVFAIFCVIAIAICIVLPAIKDVDNKLFSTKDADNQVIKKGVDNAFADHEAELRAPKRLLELELGEFAPEMERIIAESGCDRDEFNRDYYEGEIFRGNMTFLNIGKLYTIYCDESNCYLIRNREITDIAPDMGVGTASFGRSELVRYVTLRLSDGTECHLKHFIYVDRPIIAAYEKIRSHLHPCCEIYNYTS